MSYTSARPGSRETTSSSSRSSLNQLCPARYCRSASCLRPRPKPTCCSKTSADLPAPRGENAEVQEQQLHHLAQVFAEGREDDAGPAGIAVAIEIGAQEGGDRLLRRLQDAVGHLLGTGADAGLHAQRHQEVADVL